MSSSPTLVTQSENCERLTIGEKKWPQNGSQVLKFSTAIFSHRRTDCQLFALGHTTTDLLSTEIKKVFKYFPKFYLLVCLRSCGLVFINTAHLLHYTMMQSSNYIIQRGAGACNYVYGGKRGHFSLPTTRNIVKTHTLCHNSFLCGG